MNMYLHGLTLCLLGLSLCVYGTEDSEPSCEREQLCRCQRSARVSCQRELEMKMIEAAGEDVAEHWPVGTMPPVYKLKQCVKEKLGEMPIDMCSRCGIDDIECREREMGPPPDPIPGDVPEYPFITFHECVSVKYQNCSKAAGCPAIPQTRLDACSECASSLDRSILNKNGTFCMKGKFCACKKKTKRDCMKKTAKKLYDAANGNSSLHWPVGTTPPLYKLFNCVKTKLGDDLPPSMCKTCRDGDNECRKSGPDPVILPDDTPPFPFKAFHGCLREDLENCATESKCTLKTPAFLDACQSCAESLDKSILKDI